MIRTVITGVTGRMGSTLVRLVNASDTFELVGASDRKGAGLPLLDAALAARLGSLATPLSDDLAKVLEGARPHVVIDFTSAEASLVHARACAAAGVALVVGSTGFSAAQRAELVELARRIPLVVAPNMSVGVNVVIQVAARLAQLLGEGFDVEVLEAHHRMKKDAPSGTALKLADALAQALQRSPGDLRYERNGQIGERPPREIGVQTLRGGDVVGEHTVFFYGEGERVELTHRATSRDQFAKGALRAAAWVARRPPGLYDMADVLGLKELLP
ncbi:4-hydroxy-tetrahydrodipicolinate reductase [Aggregicoccus sp. 17bor-14]|uniref:4-hydroxy-tetrahydrodipicolinate reductase n=1 Tax=Myxococcaceae TaxID=31 RepID=UPI00129C1A26|nr:MULTISPECIES: 4-hydroxy-tetrahydrodipicolinate reductase [Myxococcaceae]MBF5044588.1 4-hydroxy-tetrahydrodipicolinate reductase [Simulacricoccus sp. 17bor-14]MRI90332.1 4-hydroxy-tetrahydrodipicolinate reductase [Aggregicoccus sp. 17bor-14]